DAPTPALVGGGRVARSPAGAPDPPPAAVREILERLPVKLNIFKMMAHAETSFRPLLRLGTSILAQQQLSAKLRELAILHVARVSPAEYEWVQHVPIGEAAGVSTAQIEALRGGKIDAACFDEVERLVLGVTTAVIPGGGAGAGTGAALQRHSSSPAPA